MSVLGSGRAGEWLADHIAPLAAVAVLCGLVVPSHTVAERSDVLLAALVLATAAQIDPGELRVLRRRAVAIGILAVGTLLVLTIVAWAISRFFTGDLRTGVLSLGLASTEVASVGLVGLAGGDTVLAVGVLTISLIASAILGPLLAGLLADSSGHGSALGLLGRFALVVIAPLAAGLLLRGLRPGLQRAAGTLNGVAALVVCALLYAAISGIHGGHQLVDGFLGSAAFMIASTGIGLLIRLACTGRGLDPAAIVFTTALRDFAVAAALAVQAFGTRAASVAGEYGALMLLAGAVAATLTRRHAGRHRPSG
jgi:BASS family bile acid:Na+ symporter